MSSDLRQLLTGADTPDRESLWVVMGNDYPAAIWRGTPEAVERRLNDVKEAQKAIDQKEGPRGSHGRIISLSPRVFWRVYPFQVETLS